MVVLVCTTRRIKRIPVCAASHGPETIVKWVSNCITEHESREEYYSRLLELKLICNGNSTGQNYGFTQLENLNKL